MKEIKAADLKVGDVFIDGDMLSTIKLPTEPYEIGRSIKFIIANCIVGPTDCIPLQSRKRNYFLDTTTTVLLCNRKPI